MKVAIGYRLQAGPWGGGNSFAKALIGKLTASGHTVVDRLADADIDLILIMDPRARISQATFSPGEVLRYLHAKNRNAVVVHRINECDERKGTRTMNLRLRMANFAADHTVFIASWLRNLNVWINRPDRENSVILNGGDVSIFNDSDYQEWSGREPLKLVTHHWGGNRMKGFDVYEEIDELLAREEWRKKISFTYIGNLPKDFRFKNAHFIPPKAGNELSAILASHHVYVTASINEPAGYHHIEGALCGLPLIYRMSGALPEYCADYGEGFKSGGFLSALERMVVNYKAWRGRMSTYDNTSEKMCQEYLALFELLVSQRERLIAKRKPWKEIFFPYLINQILSSALGSSESLQ